MQTTRQKYRPAQERAHGEPHYTIWVYEGARNSGPCFYLGTPKHYRRFTTYMHEPN